MANASEETQLKVAGLGPVTLPVTILASQTLPLLSAAVASTTVQVPAGASRLIFDISYALGSGAASGTAVAVVLVGYTAGALKPYYAAPFGNGATSGGVTPGGAIFDVILPPGVPFAAMTLAEAGDPTHPGTASIAVRST